jgi:3-(3-hydroxy-phenyl)propionate hydroxylase
LEQEEMRKTQCPVIIAGAGPVGMTAAADLVRQGIPVIVLEKSAALGAESRASTFHPPTLDMLDNLGFAAALIAQGLKAPKVQYGSTAEGELGTFDFGTISDLTRHPYRLQAEQFKLTRIILEALKDNPLFDIRFSSELAALTQDAGGIDITTAGNQPLRCEWLIGADGANSIVRRHQDIGFEGFTWPERLLVVTTSADIAAARQGVASVSYWADPQRWHFLLRIIGAWRVMLPVPTEMSDEEARSPEYARTSLASVLPPGLAAPIDHVTIYRVHQRVAARFRQGRSFLAGDAAHINNPLGGMGMNGGLHDALNLTARLGAVIRGEAGEAELDGYERQRRAVTMEAIQTGTIRNKKNLEARTLEDQAAFRNEIRTAASGREETRAFLRRISMIDSIERAAAL